MWKWTFVCVCVAVVLADEGSRVVRLAQGPVRGYRDPQGDLFAFYSVPYASAPTGPNKFKPPMPPPTNQEILEAVDRGIICPQASMDSFSAIIVNKTMKEDCLIASILVPDTQDNNLPVLVHIHGGAFQIGNGYWFQYKNLIRTKNMIVVTFNYRLGVHGFLCLGTKDIPGNAGMKDQVALLRWVKDNIHAFGGNPNDVTLSGGSAGAASADLVMLSKASKSLFNKVIPESGSSLAAFAMQPDPLENAKNFAKQLNFRNANDISALEKFYKSATLEQLTSDAFFDKKNSTFVFSPCVERNIGDEVFLDEDPLTILQNGNYEKLPLLIGFANMEGLLRIDFFETWKNAMNEKFSDFLPADLTFKNEEQKQEIANIVKQFYFGDKPVNNDNILSYVDFFSDVIFNIPALRSVELHLKNGHDKVYLYEYSFTDDEIPLVPHTEVRGANHCAQTLALLDGKNVYEKDENKSSEEFKKMKSVVRKLWTNFVTTGFPVPEGSEFPSWPAVRANLTPYMSLGRTLELKGALLERRVRFWNDIYDKYYHTPLPPPAYARLNTEL
ncbi:esterase FE4 [Manduca sexta]|uniref:esterase FE4 n=1 Tax=Manduca sexta TaxID=7130 RepID=UPI00188F19DF|nr:esterase FE4 [Manduca sexta]